MDRVNGEDWIDIGGGRRGFRDRNDDAGVPGTEMTAAWMNGFTEELMAVIELCGLDASAVDLQQVARAIRSGRLNWVPLVGGTANALTLALDPAPTSYAELLGASFTVVPAGTNTGPTTARANALAAKPLRRLDGAELQPGDLVTGRPVVITDIGGEWRVLGFLPSFVKRRLLANVTIYINSATGSDSNTGTAVDPFLTLQGATTYVRHNIDLNGFSLTFQTTGNLTAGVVVSGLFQGQVDVSQVIFALGASAVAATLASCFMSINGAAYRVQGGGALSATGSGYGQGTALTATGASMIEWSGVNFGSCTQAHISADSNSVCRAYGSYQISGNANRHLAALTFGTVTVSQVTVTLAGARAFAGAFAVAQQGSIGVVGTTFVGSATGARYSIDIFGSIYVAGAGVNYFPGNSAGLMGTSGDYR